MSSNPRPIELIDDYEKAFLEHPDDSTIGHQLAKLYEEQGDLERALEICQRVLQVEPKSVPAFTIFQSILTRLGFTQEEVQQTLKSFSENSTPDIIFSTLTNPASTSEESQASCTIKTWKEGVTLGEMCLKQNLWKDALNAFVQAIQLEPSLGFPHMKIQYYTLPYLNDLESLVELYTPLTQLPRVHRFAHLILGDLLTKQNKVSDAICAYKQAWVKSAPQFLPEKGLPPERKAIDYLIIGTAKAGTSSLFYYLSQHPQINNPHNKELCFFNKNHRYGYGLDWYLSQFPAPSFRYDSFLTGEATPWYFGIIGVEERVFQAFPEVKLIALLRDPVDRAISHYHMNRNMGFEDRSLEQAIADELSILGKGRKPNKVNHVYWKTEKGYLWSGLYLYFIHRWLSVFPQQQLLLLNSQDLAEKPAETLQQVLRFLNLPDSKFINYHKINMGSYPSTTEQTRKLLSDFFYIHNQELEEYLGISLGWNSYP